MSYRPSTSTAGSAKVRRKTALNLGPLLIDVDEGSSTSLTGKLSESSGPNQGTGVPNKTVHLFVDGVDSLEFAVTDANGIYAINHTWLVAGTFAYETRYLRD